jgi:hypothetical protein
MESARITAVAPLSDGRLQAWAVDYNGAIWSRWKTSTESASDWTAWTSFQALEELALSISVSPLSDGRLQLFATDVYGKVWSCWKEDTDSKAAWSSWVSFM